MFGWSSVTLVRAIRAARRLKVPVLYYGDTNLEWAGRMAPGALGRQDASPSVELLRVSQRRHSKRGVPALLRCSRQPDLRYAARRRQRPVLEAASLRTSATRRADTRRQLGLPADAFVVLFAGKLEPKKRPLDLVEALGRMDPRPHLAIAGSGALEEMSTRPQSAWASVARCWGS